MREPAVREPRDPLDRDLFIRAHPYRYGPLHRQGFDAGAVDAMPATGVVDELLSPQETEHLDLLLDPLGPVAPAHAECFVFDVVPADAGPEPDASSREDVQGRGLLGEERRLTLRQDHDPERELDLFRDRGEVTEKDEWLVKGVAVRLCIPPTRRSIP